MANHQRAGVIKDASIALIARDRADVIAGLARFASALVLAPEASAAYQRTQRCHHFAQIFES